MRSSMSQTKPQNDDLRLFSAYAPQGRHTWRWTSTKRSEHFRVEDIPSWTDGQLVTCFVCRTVAGGLPASDFKSMNKSVKYLFTVVMYRIFK